MHYKSTKHWSLTPAALAGGGLALLVLVVGWMFLVELPDPIRPRVRAMTLTSASGMAAPAAAQAAPRRLMYRNSVIPGGVRSAAELAAVVQRDPVVMAHYANFNVAAARVVRVEQPRRVHVSYRIGDQIYWTRNKVSLAVGESLLSDGRHLVRTRCGNRIADMPEGPVLGSEPAPEVLDAVFVSAEDLIDQAVNMATPAAVAATVVHPPVDRFASNMQGVAPAPAIVLPNLWNMPVSLAPERRVDAFAFTPAVVGLPKPNASGIVVSVDLPESAVIGRPEGAQPRPPATPDAKTPGMPHIPGQESPAPFAPAPGLGPQIVTPIAAPSTPAQIPEPGSAALIALALIALALVRRGTSRLRS